MSSDPDRRAVPIQHAGAAMRALSERLGDLSPTIRALLTGSARIDGDHPSAGACCLVLDERRKRPSRCDLPVARNGIG